MVLEIALAIVLAGVLALAIARLYPETSKFWFRRIMRFRQVIGAIGTIVLALLFIGTGVTLLVLAGFIILVYGFLYILFEEPIGEVSTWIGR